MRKKLTKELEDILDEIFKERKLKIRKEDIGWISPSDLAGAIADIITYGNYPLNFKDLEKSISVSERKIKEFRLGGLIGGWIIALVEEADKLRKEDVSKVIYEILPGVCKYLKPGVKLEERGRRRSRDKATSRIKG